jgi:hypothetical protein
MASQAGVTKKEFYKACRDCAVLAPQVMLDTARDVVYNLLFHLQIKTVMILFTT